MTSRMELSSITRTTAYSKYSQSNTKRVSRNSSIASKGQKGQLGAKKSLFWGMMCRIKWRVMSILKLRFIRWIRIAWSYRRLWSWRERLMGSWHRLSRLREWALSFMRMGSSWRRIRSSLIMILMMGKSSWYFLLWREVSLRALDGGVGSPIMILLSTSTQVQVNKQFASFPKMISK